MNKAFVREPEFDGRAYCPRCGALGTPVGAAVLRHHIAEAHQRSLGETAWFCPFAACETAYFNQLEMVVTIDCLRAPVYPKHPSAPICQCFGFSLDDVEADVAAGQPDRIRDLLARSKTDAAHCSALAADGQCCLKEVQRLYIKMSSRQS